MADFQYIGNPDFRGYLNYLGQQGNPYASNSISYLGTGIVDNEGKIDQDKFNALIAGYGGGEQDAALGKEYTDYLSNAWQTYQNYQNPPSTSPTGGTTTRAEYDQMIGNVNSAIGRLGTQKTSGNQGIEGAYQNALQQLLLGKNLGEQTFGQNKEANSLDYVRAKNTARVQAGGALNSLRRLLGSRGAGGSSAYNIAAPQAVAGFGTQQLGDLGGQFGKNQQALDQGWGNYMTGYNNQLTSAGGQRDEQKRLLNNSITENNSSLLQQLAQLQSERAGGGGPGVSAAQPYLNQANSLLDRLASSAPAQINYQTQAYTPPSLASYTQATAPRPTAQNQPGSDYYSPFLSALLGKKRAFA